jgi:hypothetical protein
MSTSAWSHPHSASIRIDLPAGQHDRLADACGHCRLHLGDHQVWGMLGHGGLEGRCVADRCGDLEPESSEQAGKFVSNLMVLASMAGVLAVTALVMQLARGESRAVSLGALLLPYALFTLQVLVLTAAAAVLVETVPVLRGGLGNIA